MTGAQSTYCHEVAWGETDAAGIVFYPNYFRWFDDATHEFFRQVKFPVQRMLDLGFSVPLVQCQARFLAPLRYGEPLVVTTAIADIRTRAFRLSHTVLRGDEIVADGYEVRIWARSLIPGHAALDTEALPTELVAAFQRPPR